MPDDGRRQAQRQRLVVDAVRLRLGAHPVEEVDEVVAHQPLRRDLLDLVVGEHADRAQPLKVEGDLRVREGEAPEVICNPAERDIASSLARSVKTTWRARSMSAASRVTTATNGTNQPKSAGPRRAESRTIRHSSNRRPSSGPRPVSSARRASRSSSRNGCGSSMSCPVIARSELDRAGGQATDEGAHRDQRDQQRWLCAPTAYPAIIIP